jgi:hypothetical protein
VTEKLISFINGIADTDCAVLRKKGGTYDGSAVSSGRNAWFMMRRNMDRLINMLAPPQEPKLGVNLQNVRDLADNISTAKFGNNEDINSMVVRAHTHPENYGDIIRYLCDCHGAEDIFVKIEADPSGEDGTVLAVMRDLRRYLLLIEAEMVARGVVAEHAVNVVVAPKTQVPPRKLQLDPMSHYLVNKSYRDAFTLGSAVRAIVFSKWWRRRFTSDTFMLNECVDMALGLPNEIRHCYNRDGMYWRLNIHLVPKEIRESLYPRLKRTLNQDEYLKLNSRDQSMYCFLDKTGNGFRLKDVYDAWGEVR